MTRVPGNSMKILLLCSVICSNISIDQ